MTIEKAACSFADDDFQTVSIEYWADVHTGGVDVDVDAGGVEIDSDLCFIIDGRIVLA